MGDAKRFFGLVAAALLLALSMAATPAYADEAVSFGGEDISAWDQVYLGSWDSAPIAWDVEGVGGPLAVHSHHILFQTRIDHASYDSKPDLTLENSDLYVSSGLGFKTFPEFRNEAFGDAERAMTGSFALSGGFGGATMPDGSVKEYWINEQPVYNTTFDCWDGTAVDPYGSRYADYAHSDHGVRPASTFALTSVLFASAAVGGKAGGAGAGNFAALSAASSVSAWKFTLKNSSRVISASATGTTAAEGYSAWSVPVTFSGGGTAANDYVSAILCDADGNALYYGTVANATASGTQDMAMPTGLAAGTYTLKVFSEQRNGDKATDYAGAFVDIGLTVEAAPAEHTVRFVDEDGTEISTATYAEGTAAADIVKPADPTKAATAQYTYKFAGWSPEVADVTADATYTATYTEETRSYVITFDLAGGTLDGKTGTVTRTCAYGSTITLPEPKREGYVFQYWEGSRHDAGDEYMVEGAHTFTAVWEEEPATTFTVTFDANGHGTAPAAQTVEDGGRAAKPADPTADGWEFGGWYTDSACTTVYDFSRPVTSDVTLYAKWTKGERPTPVIPRTGDPYQWASGALLAAMTVFGAFLVIAGTALGRRRGQR